MRRDAKTVADWDFDKIIPCHGVCLHLNSFCACLIIPLGCYRDGCEEGVERGIQILPRLRSRIVVHTCFVIPGWANSTVIMTIHFRCPSAGDTCTGILFFYERD
jgi:hypothetical protein